MLRKAVKGIAAPTAFPVTSTPVSEDPGRSPGVGLMHGLSQLTAALAVGGILLLQPAALLVESLNNGAPAAGKIHVEVSAPPQFAPFLTARSVNSVFTILDAHGLAHLEHVVIREAQRNGLDPLLVLAVIEAESDFNPDAVGLHGEIGLMQIKPRTAQWVAETLGLRGSMRLHDPETNIRLGTAHLGWLYRYYGDIEMALTAYNRGMAGAEARVAAVGAPVTDYSRRVLSKAW